MTSKTVLLKGTQQDGFLLALFLFPRNIFLTFPFCHQRLMQSIARQVSRVFCAQTYFFAEFIGRM